jgi:hypothetical protein
LFCLLSPKAIYGRAQSETPGFSGELPAKVTAVLPVLQEVLDDGIIHGTRIFEKEPTLTGATMVPSTPLFEKWEGPGQVFYKIRTDAVAPRHFVESADQGTIAVRYVVTNSGTERTRIRIDAIYVEKSRRRMHASDGTVESSEFKMIKDKLEAVQMAAAEEEEARRRSDSAEIVRQSFIREREDEETRLAAAQSSVRDLEKRIQSLRHEVERRVKAPGGELKSAPFRSAAVVKTLAAYTEVVIVILTPHWYGVETPEGQRGWMPLDQLEELP